ncbi:MAG: hypothetical protein OEM26_13405 [Saprospiraceae bacterium]|nr:hypothetical protein [Saprospiraceae bacterium]
MRPFKFFFGAALAITLFLFLARFIIVALVIAAVFTGLYYLFGRLHHFLTRVSWHNQYEYLQGKEADLWWIEQDTDLLAPPRQRENTYLHEFRRVAVS